MAEPLPGAGHVQAFVALFCTLRMRGVSPLLALECASDQVLGVVPEGDVSGTLAMLEGLLAARRAAGPSGLAG